MYRETLTIKRIDFENMEEFKKFIDEDMWVGDIPDKIVNKLITKLKISKGFELSSLQSERDDSGQQGEKLYLEFSKTEKNI